jgi:AcrR family transcriptional regulator
MATSSSTRERIIDEAMRLFGENGYKGTSVTQIEKAAGLTPGAGGIYHHFRTKEALLAAGIERHLARLDALREIRQVFTGVGDLRAELTITARYALAELDSESELLRIMATESRSRPQLVEGAVQELIGATYTAFGGWLESRAGLAADRAAAAAAVGLGALISSRLLRTLLPADPVNVDDNTFVATWVEMMMGLLM